MFKTEISQKNKVILLVLLIILNIMLRVPSIPHEKGRDSFMVHSLANSISYFGEAKWVINWLSIFGLYPYSIPSAVPFSLSGIEQITGIEMEKTILLFSIILGLTSIFFVYLLAGLVFNDFLFKYLMSLLFSTAQGILLFSTWEISSRGPFIIFVPLFIFLLLRNKNQIREISLLIILFIFLAATHHYFFFLIIFVFSFIFFKIASKIFSKYKLITKVKFVQRNPIYIYLFYLLGLSMVILFPFFSRFQFAGASRYSYMVYIFLTNVRWTGPFIIFAVGGVIYFLFNEKKNFNGLYLLGLTVIMFPFTFNEIYGVYIYILFVVFLSSIGLRNLLKNTKHNKVLNILFILVLITTISFSAFYNHYRTGELSYFWYMDDKTMVTGNWINDKMSNDKNLMLHSVDHHNLRIASRQSDLKPIIFGGTLGFTYGVIDKNVLSDLEKVPMTSTYFYFEGPFKTTKDDPYQGTTMSWFFLNKNIKIIKDIYNIDYILLSNYVQNPIGFTEQMKERIYDNGMLFIYDLRYI